jgi:hypothetical protein
MIGATTLAGAPAHADNSTAERAGLRQPVVQAAKGEPTAAQLAKRNAFAERMGIPSIQVTGPWHLVNDHSGLCLTVAGASTANNANIVQYTCDFSYPYNEDWYFDGAHIINGHSGLCLTVAGASTADNANLVQFGCENTFPYNENWYAEPLYGGSYYWHLWNGHSNKCMTVGGASLANNANIVQYTCDYSYPYNEEWIIVAS